MTPPFRPSSPAATTHTITDLPDYGVAVQQPQVVLDTLSYAGAAKNQVAGVPPNVHALLVVQTVGNLRPTVLGGSSGIAYIGTPFGSVGAAGYRLFPVLTALDSSVTWGTDTAGVANQTMYLIGLLDPLAFGLPPSVGFNTEVEQTFAANQVITLAAGVGGEVITVWDFLFYWTGVSANNYAFIRGHTSGRFSVFDGTATAGPFVGHFEKGYSLLAGEALEISAGGVATPNGLRGHCHYTQA